jgi:hypothetical protein
VTSDFLTFTEFPFFFTPLLYHQSTTDYKYTSYNILHCYFSWMKNCWLYNAKTQRAKLTEQSCHSRRSKSPLYIYVHFNKIKTNWMQQITVFIDLQDQLNMFRTKSFLHTKHIGPRCRPPDRQPTTTTGMCLLSRYTHIRDSYQFNLHTPSTQ